MNAADVLALVKAGFTKEEILGFNAPAPAENAESTTIQQEVINSASVPLVPQADEKASGEKDLAPEALPAAVTGVLDQINATLSKLQQFAIRTDGQPEKRADSYKDILGSTYNRKD